MLAGVRTKGEAGENTGTLRLTKVGLLLSYLVQMVGKEF